MKALREVAKFMLASGICVKNGAFQHKAEYTDRNLKTTLRCKDYLAEYNAEIAKVKKEKAELERFLADTKNCVNCGGRSVQNSALDFGLSSISSLNSRMIDQRTLKEREPCWPSLRKMTCGATMARAIDDDLKGNFGFLHSIGKGIYNMARGAKQKFERAVIGQGGLTGAVNRATVNSASRVSQHVQNFVKDPYKHSPRLDLAMEALRTRGPDSIFEMLARSYGESDLHWKNQSCGAKVNITCALMGIIATELALGTASLGVLLAAKDSAALLRATRQILAKRAGEVRIAFAANRMKMPDSFLSTRAPAPKVVQQQRAPSARPAERAMVPYQKMAELNEIKKFLADPSVLKMQSFGADSAAQAVRGTAARPKAALGTQFVVVPGQTASPYPIEAFRSKVNRELPGSFQSAMGLGPSHAAAKPTAPGVELNILTLGGKASHAPGLFLKKVETLAAREGVEITRSGREVILRFPDHCPKPRTLTLKY